MKTIFLVGLLLLGVATAFAQAREPDKKSDKQFRYYKPGLADSLKFFSYPAHPDLSKWQEKVEKDFKFKNWDQEEMERDFKFKNWDQEKMEKDFKSKNWDQEKVEKDFKFKNWDEKKIERDFYFKKWDQQKIEKDFKINTRDLDFHSALPTNQGMPTYKPLLRDRMTVLIPDSTIEYHLRIKPLKGNIAYK